ncbi:MAG: ATP-binding protein [Prosthecobacter sp.]
MTEQEEVPATRPPSHRNDELQRHTTLVSEREQQRIDARNQLDGKIGCLNRMHAFSIRALQASSDEAFAGMVADALLDVFELEAGLFWLFDAQGRLLPEPAASSGFQSVHVPLELLRTCLESRLSAQQDMGCFFAAAGAELQHSGFHFSHMLVGCCRHPDGRPLALLFAGVTTANEALHENVAQSFEVFMAQVAALHANRATVAVIQRQIMGLHESEERLWLALKGSEIGLWDWNVDTHTVVLSTEWKAMLGYRDDEIVDHPDAWHSRIHPDDLEHSLQLFNEHIAGASDVYENQHRLRHKDGRYLWIIARGRALRDENGRARRFVGTHLDISKQKALEERLREAEDLQRQARLQAESASRAKSVFVASMSHEIRTPMNGVIGMLQLLRDTTLSAAQSSLLTIAEQSATALLGIIGDVLDFSKVEAGRIELRREPFDLRALVTHVIELIRYRAKAKHIQLECHMPKQHDYRVLGDEGRLRQVLINLIGNAINFTDHGRVQLCVEIGSGVMNGHSFSFRIRDTGIGIPPESLKHLFEPFYQDDSQMDVRRHAGTGLGLAISQSLVRLMGGDILVSSVKGVGSTFRFTLSLPRGGLSLPAAPLQISAANSAPDRLEGRILVVDDSETSRMLVKWMMEPVGLTVDFACNGKEALAKAEKSSYDVILMDCQMPVMDGFEATRLIRQLPDSLARVPIIALTADVDTRCIQECNASGMNDHLSKPVQKDQLLRKITTWLTSPSVSG